MYYILEDTEAVEQPNDSCIVLFSHYILVVLVIQV